MRTTIAVAAVLLIGGMAFGEADGSELGRFSPSQEDADRQVGVSMLEVFDELRVEPGSVLGACPSRLMESLILDDPANENWSAPMGGPGAFAASPSSGLGSLIVFDDGASTSLYAGGSFVQVGGVSALRIARWDGEQWSPLGDGLSGAAFAMAVFDDGDGPALYVGGTFVTAGGVEVNRIARWDGHEWSSVGGGTNGTVRALSVYDDGSGPALYAAGSFTIVSGDVEANHIARWDGQQWSAVGHGLNGDVSSLVTMRLGGTDKLFVGGVFTAAGELSTNNIAMWDGNQWSPLGGGTNGAVRAMAAFNDGSGPSLFVGGSFTTAGDTTAFGIARWSGSEWHFIGHVWDGAVWSIAAYHDGTTHALFIGGTFTTVGSAVASRIARWDGVVWSAVGGDGMNAGTVNAMAVFNDGTGLHLYAAGNFERASGLFSRNIARWDGERWRTLGSAPAVEVIGLGSFDSGSGPELHVGVSHHWLEGNLIRTIARWDGARWWQLGGGLSGGGVGSMLEFDDGTGTALFVGGAFFQAEGQQANHVARWDGKAWSTLGKGLPGTFFAQVNDFALFDDGSGLALFACGSFSLPRLRKWDGAEWTAQEPGLNGFPWALAVHDDGSGPAMYVGGSSLSVDGVGYGTVVRWDGENWSPLEGGLNARVVSLVVFDDGTGPALYAGGEFTASSSGEPMLYIARWDGTSWSPVGDGFNGAVWALHVHEDCSGPALYAGGLFSASGEMPINRVARWDGASWSPLGSGIVGGESSFMSFPPGVYAFKSFSDKAGPALYVGGNFHNAGGKPAGHVARWAGGAPPIGDLNFDCTVDISDLLMLFDAWGVCPADGNCPADFNGDGVVDVSDLLILFNNWG
jgi:trimeric autotransporter adhesin